jgi:hypothetical protein
VATDNVPGGEEIPGGNEIWIPAGDGDPFSLREKKIPGNARTRIFEQEVTEATEVRGK